MMHCARCETLATGAVGCTQLDGRTVFLEGLLPGEEVSFSSVEKRNGRLFAKDPVRLSDSPLRVRPSCPYSGRCGGCDFDHVGCEDSARLKSGIVKANIERSLGEDVSEAMKAPVPSPDEGYRIRSRIHVSLRDRKIGFLAKRSNELVPVTHCPRLSQRLDGILSEPSSIFRSAQSALFSKGTNRKTGFVELSLFDSDDRVLIEGEEGVRTVGQYRFHVSAAVFFQSNAYLLPLMLDEVKENVVGDRIMDLYSGVGTFSTLFEGEDREVWAVERDRLCLSLARKNAPDAHFFTDDVALWARKAPSKVDTVIVDPPRTGLGPAAGTIASWKCGRIVYVSCNSATLAQDLKVFSPFYSIDSVKVFDFYPSSGHEETVCVLTLR